MLDINSDTNTSRSSTSALSVADADTVLGLTSRLVNDAILMDRDGGGEFPGLDGGDRDDVAVAWLDGRMAVAKIMTALCVD